MGASVGYARSLWLTVVRLRELAIEQMTPLGPKKAGALRVAIVCQIMAGSQGPTSCFQTCTRIRNTFAMPDAYARRSVCKPNCLMTQRGQGNAWQRAGVHRFVASVVFTCETCGPHLTILDSDC